MTLYEQQKRVRDSASSNSAKAHAQTTPSTIKAQTSSPAQTRLSSSLIAAPSSRASFSSTSSSDVTQSSSSLSDADVKQYQTPVKRDRLSHKLFTQPQRWRDNNTFSTPSSAFVASSSMPARAPRVACSCLDISDIEGSQPQRFASAKELPLWSDTVPVEAFQHGATRFGRSPHIKVLPEQTFENVYGIGFKDEGASLSFGITIPSHLTAMRATIAERTAASNTHSVRPSTASCTRESKRRAAQAGCIFLLGGVVKRVQSKVACWQESAGEISRSPIPSQSGSHEWQRFTQQDLNDVSNLR